MRRMFDLLLKKTENKPVYGMYRYANQINYASPSVFSFGITWAECDKIVMDVYGLTTDRNYMLASNGVCGIGYNPGTAAAFTFYQVPNASANVSPAEITDGKRHTVVFTFNHTSTAEITNTWDRNWAPVCGYISIEFWKGNTLLKRFVPSTEDLDYDPSGLIYVNHMVDTVSGEKIRASIGSRYLLQEVQ